MRAFVRYMSEEPESLHASSDLSPMSPFTNRRSVSLYFPFHSPHRSQFGNDPTWYSPPQSHGSAKSLHRASVGSLAMSRITGGRPIGSPSWSRVIALVRSKRNPSTWYSVTQCLRESRTSSFTTGWLQLKVLPHPV